MKRLANFINGEFCAPQGAKYLASFNPATGEHLFDVPDSDANDIDAAVRAAQEAFPSWAQLSVADRAGFCEKIAAEIERRFDEFVEAESEDQGKPLSLARRVDIPRASLNFRFFAGAVRHHLDEAIRNDPTSINYVHRQPIGVAGIISPWNLPIYLLTWKMAPALATGNTVVCKPSEMTSATAALLGEVIQTVGLPKGVINLVFGYGHRAGQALVDHPLVPMISFTGGTKTGEQIAKSAAPHLKKVSLELGGKNANIIFADADFKKAVETSVFSSFQNQGEICLCGSRIYVQEGIFEAFTKAFVEQTGKLKVGDPRAADTFMGPLVSAEHRDKVLSYIQIAKTEGAQILTGGGKPEGLSDRVRNGYFVAPTIVTGVSAKSRLQNEEIFGPVVTVSSFKSEKEVMELANSTSYGLSASVWTQDINRAMRCAEHLRVGTVWINTWNKRDLRLPFGGVKKSGLGREGQEDSIRFFTEAKTVCIDHGDLQWQKA